MIRDRETGQSEGKSVTGEGARLSSASTDRAPLHLALLDRDLRITAACRIDSSHDDLVGLSIFDIAAPCDHELLQAAADEVLRSGQPQALELRIATSDGSFAQFQSWLLPLVSAEGSASIALVGDQGGAVGQLGPRQSRELAQSEERFRTLVEYAPEAMVILDVDTGRFVAASANACVLFGLPREQLLQVGPADVSPERQPDGAPSVEAAMERIRSALAGKHAVFEWAHCDSTGKVIPCEVRLIRLPHSERKWVRGSVIDISERKRAEEERRRLTMDLAQAQKMQAIGQLTGGVAHDFNNLLTVIMGSVTMIDRKPEDPRTVKRLAEHALSASQRATALTQRLLAFARRQPLRPTVVDVNRLIAGMEDLLRRTLGETIAIETNLWADLWACEIDAVELENVVLNLAINARDAMPDGGRLVIETTNAILDEPRAPAHQEVTPGGYVMLTISDTGVGMSSEVLGQAFEPFFTTKDSGRGSGLGLSMVYGFVKQSGGHIKIESEPGEGTTVNIYLPRSTGSVTGPERRYRPERAPSGGDGRLVLVVEDELAVQALVVEELESLGYRTLAAGDVDSALELLESHLDVALILTDVVLPGSKNGTDLSRLARTMRPGLPVLLMSGYAGDAVVRDGRLDPGVALLEKPFTQCELAAAVEEAIDPSSPGRRPVVTPT